MTHRPRRPTHSTTRGAINDPHHSTGSILSLTRRHSEPILAQNLRIGQSPQLQTAPLKVYARETIADPTLTSHPNSLCSLLSSVFSVIRSLPPLSPASFST